jgi:hypothetical protein
MASEEGFFSRWARRKSEAKEEVASEAAAPPQTPPISEPEPPPLPTLADVAALTRDSDYSRFVAAGVDEGVKRAALKKLFFSDPHFNVMDGLDTYIDDYNKPDPLPTAMLRKMWQSKSLGLFDDEEKPSEDAVAQASPDGAAAPPVPQSQPEPVVPHDENPDLRLQPDDEAGRPGPDAGPGPRQI